MQLKILRFIGLILATLTVGMKFAHSLELIPKLELEPDIYILVQSNLYRFFATVGVAVDIGAVLTILIVTVLVYRKPAFRFTLAAFSAMILSLLIWGFFVAPANAPLREWYASGVIPADWTHWRDQWQYAQFASFLCDLTGYSLFVISILRETDTRIETVEQN